MLYTIEGAEAYNIGEGSVDDVAIHAIDDKTLEVTLVNPIDYFISTLVIPQFSVVPEAMSRSAATRSSRTWSTWSSPVPSS